MKQGFPPSSLRSLEAGCRLAPLVLTTLLFACRKDAGDDSEAHPTVNAATIVIAKQPFNETIEAIGVVVARTAHVATLSAPTQGRISEVLVSPGQVVQAGQVLISMDPAQFRAQVASAEAALSAAEKSAARQERLANEGIVPRKDAETAAADLEKARADAEEARRVSGLSTLRSPINGVVTKMTATLGATVDASAPLVEIADPTALDVLLNVTPTDAARIRTGQKVSISAGQSSGGEMLGIGDVADVGTMVDSATRAVSVRVQVPTTRRPMRIGETVSGSVIVATKAATIVVPSEALVPEGDAFHVFVVDANNVAHERDVTIGSRSPKAVEILEGLTVGERVVTLGAYGLQDSVKVAPIAVPDTGKEKADTGTEQP
jgi:membrane fusion protein (multidrug efflux system)